MIFNVAPRRPGWMAITTASVALLFSSVSSAQQAPENPTAFPAANTLPAATEKPPLAAYRSVFETYPPYVDEKVRSWKEANDAVGRIGGWRAYAKEVANSEIDPARSAPNTAPNPAPGARP